MSTECDKIPSSCPEPDAARVRLGGRRTGSAGRRLGSRAPDSSGEDRASAPWIWADRAAILLSLAQLVKTKKVQN